MGELAAVACGLALMFQGAAGPAPQKARPALFLNWSENGPPVRWQLAAGEGYGTASVAGKRLFHFDRHGERARLTCTNAETGQELWRSEYPTDYEDYYGFGNGPRSSPVVDGDRVYTFGAEGRLRCHRVDDGALLWDVDTAADFGVVQNFFGVASTPVVEGDLLIVPIGGSPPDSPDARTGKVRGAGSGIVAFEKLTGQVRYRVTDELASYSSPLLRTIDKRRWGFYFARGGLVGFEPSTGKVDFEFPWRATRIETVNAATPVVVEDTVFITESYGPGAALLRVKPGGYEVLRQDPPGRKGSLRSHWATPIYHDGYLYGCHGSGSAEAELRAVEYRTGKLAWSEPKLGRTTLLHADGQIVVLSEYGELIVIEATPQEFRPVARATPSARGPSGKLGPLLKHPAWSPPILSEGLLYVRGSDRLVCFDLRHPE